MSSVKGSDPNSQILHMVYIFMEDCLNCGRHRNRMEYPGVGARTENRFRRFQFRSALQLVNVQRVTFACTESQRLQALRE